MLSRTSFLRAAIKRLTICDSRRPHSRHQERSKSPVRRYNDNIVHLPSTPTHRDGHFKGSSSRGRQLFRGAALSRGGRGNSQPYNNKHAWCRPGGILLRSNRHQLDCGVQDRVHGEATTSSPIRGWCTSSFKREHERSG